MSAENIEEIESKEEPETEVPQKVEEGEEVDKTSGEEERPVEGVANEEGDEDEEPDDDEEEEVMSSDFVDYDNEELNMKAALRKIQIHSPELIEEEAHFDPLSYPPSYKDSNKKEQQALLICKRFLNHYNYMYDRRQPVFLKPQNEFGVEKMVCTTICPTQMPYRDLLDWPDISQFVARFLVYKKLQKPMILPDTLYSPHTVLSRKRGHCFEFSTVLCSMLIAAGYDAYVVSGYATREVANQDLSYSKCPLIEEDVTVYPRSQTLIIKKYTVRPPRSYQSEYLLRMKTKKDKEVQRGIDEGLARKLHQKQLDEAPPEDELSGWRIHSWVLVLAGRRDIKRSFFVEPTVGVSHPLDWDGYMGVETLWNNFNYYINVQQDQHPKTMQGLQWDIGDSCDWEYLFVGRDLHVTKTASEIFRDDRRLSFLGDLCEEELPYDPPTTWSLPLKISRADYDLRYPNGKISRRWYKAKLDRFAPYLHPDGLVTMVRVFYDLEWQDLHYTEEFFEHRSDLLYKRFSHYPTGKVIEYFLDGRDDALMEHHYFSHTPGPETDRILVFFKNRRLDSLWKRQESPSFLKEWYTERPDRQTYRETTFGPQGRLYERGLGPEARPIETLTQTFSRNHAVAANKDIAKVVFTVRSDEIDIDYHVEESKLYGSTRHFTKPNRWWDTSFYLDWKRELHHEFQADLFARPYSELVLFQMMVGLMDTEAKGRVLTRKSEKETTRLLQVRANDLARLQLTRTYVDADIVPSWRVARLQEKARLKAIIELKKADILKDYLQPYLQRFGLAKVTTKKQAMRVTEALMSDARNTIISTVNRTKTRYEQLKEEIREMQMIHVYKFSQLTMDEMQDYRDDLTLKMFLGHVLGKRINDMKVYSPKRYRALYDQIKADPRMTPYM